MADMDLIESIRRVEQDIRETLAIQKSTNAEFLDAMSQLPEYGEMQKAADVLRSRKVELSVAVRNDQDCHRLRAELDERASKLADLREILSLHLIRYRENQEFLEELDSKKVRPILVTAKLGKPEYQQETMFQEATK